MIGGRGVETLQSARPRIARGMRKIRAWKKLESVQILRLRQSKLAVNLCQLILSAAEPAKSPPPRQPLTRR
jgi:hypothetical protein